MTTVRDFGRPCVQCEQRPRSVGQTRCRLCVAAAAAALYRYWSRQALYVSCRDDSGRWSTWHSNIHVERAA